MGFLIFIFDFYKNNFCFDFFISLISFEPASIACAAVQCDKCTFQPLSMISYPTDRNDYRKPQLVKIQRTTECRGLSLSLGLSSTAPAPNILDEGPEKVPEREDQEDCYELTSLRNDRDTTPTIAWQYDCHTSFWWQPLWLLSLFK